MKKSSALVAEFAGSPEELALCDALRSDFLKSYQFSQGDPDLQKGFWCRIRDFHAARAGGTLAVDMNLFDKVVVDFHFPGSHVLKPVQNGPSDEDVKWVTYGGKGAEVQFEGDIKDYRKIMAGIPLPYRKPDLSLEQICTEMVLRDIYFQSNERGYRAQSDKHASYFREYFVRQRPTGSEVYDDLFCTISTYLEDTPPAELSFTHRLGNLIDEWGVNHPGQSFYPVQPSVPLTGLVTV